MRTVAIVQARIGSTRLPGKMLLHLRGHAVIDWVLRRIQRSRRIDAVVLALPERAPNELLAARAPDGVRCVFGPEDDVVGRFLLAARIAAADAVVRICADNPLVCPELVDELVDEFAASGVDYAWNHVPRGNRFPDGLGAEICSRHTLERIAMGAKAPSEREHLFNHVLARPGEFRAHTYDPREEWLRRPDLKLDLDTWDDYRRLARLEVGIDDGPAEIVAACGRNP